MHLLFFWVFFSIFIVIQLQLYVSPSLFFFFKSSPEDIFFIALEKEEGRQKHWLIASYMGPDWGLHTPGLWIEPTTQARMLTRNQTHNLSVTGQHSKPPCTPPRAWFTYCFMYSHDFEFHGFPYHTLWWPSLVTILCMFWQLLFIGHLFVLLVWRGVYYPCFFIDCQVLFSLFIHVFASSHLTPSSTNSDLLEGKRPSLIIIVTLPPKNLQKNSFLVNVELNWRVPRSSRSSVLCSF